MKKIILSTSLLLLSGSALSQNVLSAKNLIVERKGNQVEVSFEATSLVKSMKINDTYIFTPTIVNGEKRYTMPSFLFGSKQAKILNARRGVSVKQFYFKGDTVRYSQNAPYSDWMSDGVLALKTEITGCCDTTVMRSHLMTSNILPTPVVAPFVELVEVPVAALTTGKQVDEKHSFIASTAEWLDEDGTPRLDLTTPLTMGKSSNEHEQRNIESYLSEIETDMLKLYFEVSNSDIDPKLGPNEQSVRELSEAVKAILNSSDSKISHVIIAGSASPEGSLEMNDRLAWNRALSLKELLIEATSIEESLIRLYNGSENWMGLRKLVAQSTMDYRDEILNIIDNTSVAKGRESRLMALKGGIPYRNLLTNFFPQLRHAAYIKVYYQDTEPGTVPNKSLE